jgi:hypothetical protein
MGVLQKIAFYCILSYISELKGAVSSRAHLFCTYIKFERTGCFFQVEQIQDGVRSWERTAESAIIPAEKESIQAQKTLAVKINEYTYR